MIADKIEKKAGIGAGISCLKAKEAVEDISKDLKDSTEERNNDRKLNKELSEKKKNTIK